MDQLWKCISAVVRCESLYESSKKSQYSSVESVAHIERQIPAASLNDQLSDYLKTTQPASPPPAIYPRSSMSPHLVQYPASGLTGLTQWLQTSVAGLVDGCDTPQDRQNRLTTLLSSPHATQGALG